MDLRPPSLPASTTLCTRAALTALAAVAAALLLAPLVARADERGGAANRFALDLGGVRYGLVHAALAGEKTPAGERLVIDAAEVGPTLATLVQGFARGIPVKKDLRLTSGAVVKKAADARLVAVKLPALGSGGSADVELAFLVPAVTTQPLLSAKEGPPPPASARITGFRLDLSGMNAIEAPKLDAITVTHRTDGTATTGEIALEVAAGGAPPFVAWQKAGAGRPPAKTLRIEYVGGDGAALFELQLERCTPSSVKPLGASGTTRITLACGGLKAR